MKTIFSILILLSISFNAQADHKSKFDVDDWSTYEWYSDDGSQGNGVYVNIYNKTKRTLKAKKFLWQVVYSDNTRRIYKSHGSDCGSYSQCQWSVRASDKDIKNILIHHD